jgi:hypothetical protein
MPKNLDPNANSEKALDKQIHSELLKETKKIKKAFSYTNDGEAFIHVFVRAYLDISDDDAAEAAQVGVGGHDKGIDAFFVDESDKIVHVFGGTLESRSFGPEILVDIERARAFLRSPLGADVKPDLQTIWSIYETRMRDPDFSTHYAFVTLGHMNEEAKKGLAELRKKMEKEKWDVDVFERRDTLAWISFPFLLKGPDAEFTTPKEPLVFAPAKVRSAVFPIKASELVNIVTKNRYTVFGLNLREYYGTNPVNRQIAKSIDDPQDRELFWYLNLGVDAICDHFEPMPAIQRKIVGESKGYSVEVKNLRIVNGIQTSVMLRDHRDKVANSYLMLRLIETDNTSLAYKIAVAKNRQTPIRGRDLFAQEPLQLALEHAAAHFAKPFFYERRERDWAISRDRPEIRRKFGQRVIKNDDVARSYLATVLQRPFEAEHFGRRIFYEYGGLYEEVFSTNLEIRDLIVADEILQVASDQQKVIRRRFKELNQKDLAQTLSEDERNELRDCSYLVHAKWYLMALLSYFITSFAAEDDQKRLFTLDRPISKTRRGRLEKLHGIAVKLVLQYMMDKQDTAVKAHVRFPGARHLFALKGTYGSLKDSARVWVDRDVVKHAMD